MLFIITLHCAVFHYNSLSIFLVQAPCMKAFIVVHIIADDVIIILTHLSLASLLWDIGKQNSPRCDAAERGVPSGAILFA